MGRGAGGKTPFLPDLNHLATWAEPSAPLGSASLNFPRPQPKLGMSVSRLAFP